MTHHAVVIRSLSLCLNDELVHKANSMVRGDNAPSQVHSLQNDMEAAIVVGVLCDAGLNASAAGGFTAGLKTEAPSEAAIVVAPKMAEAASEILQSARNNPM